MNKQRMNMIDYRRRFLLTCIGAALALVGISSTASAADITLTYAFFAPASTFPGKQMERWADLVEKRTNEEVKINTFPGGSLLGAKDMYQGVRSGVADIGLGAPSYDPGSFPLSYGLSLPVGFHNAEVASMTYWQLLKEFKPAAFKDFKIITVFTTEPSYIQSKKSVRNLSELKGMKLRGVGSGVVVLNALGAAPTGMPMPSVPQAVQTGVIDGILTSREVLRDFKLANSLHYVTDYPMGVIAFAAVMKKSRWEALPKNVQKVINELGPEMAKWTGNFHDDDVQDAVAWAEKRKGLEMVELAQEQRSNWNDRLKPLIAKWVKSHEQDAVPAAAFLKRLHELQSKYSNSSDE